MQGVLGGTMKLIALTCFQQAKDALLEPISHGLPAGLLASPIPGR